MLRVAVVWAAVVVAACPLLASPVSPASAPRPGNVQESVWEATSGDVEVETLVVLRERADLMAATLTETDRVARRRAVFAALRDTAERSQAELRGWLRARGVKYRPFLTLNALRLVADRALLVALASRQEIDRIVANPRVRLDEPTPASDDQGLLANTAWGVDRINAPAVWALGFRGEGIVVGGQDTGIRWTHEAVRDQYRGWDGTTASHDFNWHDSIHVTGGSPCGVDSAIPCDDHGHGTHTIGTAAGGTSDEIIGVAPGAKWIACRNMDQGYGTPATYIECFDFLLAPWAYGADPSTGDPAKGADVTVNSWTCPPSEGCAWDVLEPAVNAHRAAGIFTEFSAGNAGSGCGSVNDPGAIYAASFAVGASNDSDGLAGFSSRGPADYTGLPKPDVVAPGVGVRSATGGGDNEYGAWNGTSMAGPHVAGAVALLWSALPALRGDVPATEALLRRTARPLRAVVESCGGDYAFGPNNSWGKGLVDVARALQYASSPATELLCADGLDDDGDGFADCADADCAGAPNCPEAGNCLDRVDNDQDGATDCQDLDCLGDPLCPEFGNCADGLDNDRDGRTDCSDRDCDIDPVCPGLAVGPLMVPGPTGPTPDLAAVFAAACRYPAWRLCPESIVPGALPGMLVGEAAPGAPGLRLYQHSDPSAVVGFVKSGADLVYGP